MAGHYAHSGLIGRPLVPDVATDGDFGLDAVAQRLEQSTQPATGTPRMHCANAVPTVRLSPEQVYLTTVRMWPLFRCGCHHGCVCFVEVTTASQLRLSALSSTDDFGLGTVTQSMSSMQLAPGAWPV